MENSLVVLGKTRADALRKAALLLNCEPGQVAYEVLQEAKPRKFGLAGTLCKIRAQVAAGSESVPSPPVPEEIIPGLPMPWPEPDIDHVPSEWFLQELEEAISQYISPEDAGGDEAEISKAKKPSACQEITGDVTLSQSPLEFAGDLRILGNIASGVFIHAAGEISIEGSVERAYLEAGFDITVTQSIRGTVLSKYGNISCRTTWDADLEATHGRIFVRETAMQSKIHAAESVTIGETLIGGVCYGEHFVEVKTAGSETGVPTILFAGRNRQLANEIERIRERALALTALLADCGRVYQTLLPIEQRREQLPAADRIRLWDAATGKAVINDTLVHLSRRKQRLLGMINAEKTARISIKDRAYPPVRVIVDDAPIELQGVTHYATFTKDYTSGKLRMTPYR